MSAVVSAPLASAQPIASRCRKRASAPRQWAERSPAASTHWTSATERARPSERRRRGSSPCAKPPSFLADREGGWRNEQHRRDVHNSLTSHVLPIIGGLSVSDIDTPQVLKVLEANNLWRSRPETGNRVRARIEMLLDWAAARGYRDRENPAKWRGHLDSVLPNPKVLQPTKHHPALGWPELPAFMADLRGRAGLAARTLEFCILNASRIGRPRDQAATGCFNLYRMRP